MVPFLFIMGLCALSHAAPLTDFIPHEERVQMEYLANGVVSYVQENAVPAQSGSFRVVLRKPPCEEVLYTYDGKLDSVETIENFFTYCKDRAISDLKAPLSSVGSGYFSCSTPSYFCVDRPHEMAVIAVGDFPYKEMQQMIQSHFASVALIQQETTNPNPQPVQIGSDAAISKVAMRIAYLNRRMPMQTLEDLRETWEHLLIQDIYQQRMERCSRSLKESWVHPHPRFFYPVNGHMFASEEHSENLFSFLLWQVETIRNNGFYEDEFSDAKRKLLNQLQYLSSKSIHPDDAFLASYYVDQFLLGNQCLSYETFLKASAQLIEAMQSNDLLPHIESFFADGNRSIQVVYPSITHSELLTHHRIEEIVSHVSLRAGFSEAPEENVWNLDGQRENIFSESLPIHLTSNNETLPFRLANNDVLESSIPIPPSTEPFYQLPLNDNERRVIKSIINTVAETSIFLLPLEKSSLKKKGDKINHVHPLRFMGYIFSSAELRSNVKVIKKSSFKWDAFIDGFSKRMREEFANNNVLQHINGFAQQVGASTTQVHYYVERKDWEGLVKSLL